MQRDDVRMVKPGGELYLAQEAFRPHGSRELRVQQLQRHLAIVLHVVGQEDRGRPPAGQLALDPITAGHPGLQARQQVHRGQ